MVKFSYIIEGTTIKVGTKIDQVWKREPCVDVSDAPLRI